MSANLPESAASHAADGTDFSAWVGRSELADDVASRSSVLGLAAVLDREVAGSADDAQLAPLSHWLHFTPTAPMRDLGPDGHPKLGAFMPPLDLPRRMWAGSEVSFLSPITVGQRLTRTTTIESITPKHGASGRLCFVVLRHDISTDGVPSIVDRQTLVYRESVVVDRAAGSPEAESPRRPPRADAEVPAGWDWSFARRPIETTLFRYSALTFNTHRIHYDLPYATEVEGYPGLVVHGPLLATYLVDGFREAHPDATVTAFSFSARAPMFAGELLHVAGRRVSDAMTDSGAGSSGSAGSTASAASGSAPSAAHREELAIVGPGGMSVVTGSISYT